jgi:hypothetical protein
MSRDGWANIVLSSLLTTNAFHLGDATGSPVSHVRSPACRQPASHPSGAAALTHDLWRIIANHMPLQDWVRASGANKVMKETPLDAVRIGDVIEQSGPTLRHGALHFKPCRSAVQLPQDRDGSKVASWLLQAYGGAVHGHDGARRASCTST